MSWILEEEKLLMIQHNHPREHMDSITCYCLFVNTDYSIDNITTDSVILDWNADKGMKYISKERVLGIIQDKRKRSRYIYKDSCLYLVDLEPEHIQTYSKSTVDVGSDSFFVKLPIVDDIYVPPSIFVFHSINAVYFVFQEIQSILKKGTKRRVIISDNNKTRKNLNQSLYK